LVWVVETLGGKDAFGEKVGEKGGGERADVFCARFVGGRYAGKRSVPGIGGGGERRAITEGGLLVFTWGQKQWIPHKTEAGDVIKREG